MPDESIEPPQPGTGSVTIGGMPVAFDWQCQLRHFMRDRLPAEDTLFARWLQDEVPPNPLVEGSSNYLVPPFPDLPKIEIGEFQFPSGASRYGRALYAVDWATMLQIAQDAWGYELPTELIDPDGDPDDPDNQRSADPQDVPADWGIDHYSVELVINDQNGHTVQAPMFALPPYRVTGNGIDLWLLPLVDERFLFNRRPHVASSTPPEDWQSLFELLASDMGSNISVDAVPDAYGSPDYRLWKTDNPAAELMDIAALSVGMRVVFDGQLRVLSAASSETRRTANLQADDILLSGGKRGLAAKPNGLELFCDRGDGKFEKRTSLIGGGSGTVKIAAWSSWYLDYDGLTLVNEAATNNFVAQVASDLADWFNSGGQYCFAGCHAYLPSGFDDYLSIQVLETNRPEEYRFTSRIYELPQVFLPPAFMVGGHECKQYGRFEYQLLTNWFGGLALAYKRSMESEELPNPYVVIRDPLGTFSYQKNGDKGHMVIECDKYYARQGPCGNQPAASPEPPAQSGACCIPKSVPGDNFCQETTASECAAAGGIWMGSATVCGDGSICIGVGE